MKKSLVLMTVLAMVFSLMALACGSDDDDGAGTEGGPCRVLDVDADEDAVAEFTPCDEGLFCDEDLVCQPLETGDTDGDEDLSGTEGEACREEGEPCDEGLFCDEDDICVAEEEVLCIDEDCPGAALCNDDDECEVFCIDGKFNQSCPGTYELSTEVFGECQPVPCTSDLDCEGLENCDNPDLGSTPSFICDTNSQCKRGTR